MDADEFCPPVRSKQDRKALLAHMRAYDRATRMPGRHGGNVGDRPLQLLEVLAFRLSDPLTGRCVASCADIMRVTNWARTTVKEAAAWLVELAGVVKHRLVGDGPYGCGANGWEFPDPREVFHRLFTAQRVRAADPNSSQENLILIRPKRDRRRQVVLAEVEAGPEPRGVMTDTAWEAAVEGALNRARGSEVGAHAELAGNPGEDPALPLCEPPGLGGLADTGNEVVIPVAQGRVAGSGLEQPGNADVLSRPEGFRRHVVADGWRERTLGQVGGIFNLAQVVFGRLHRTPPGPQPRKPESPGNAAKSHKGVPWSWADDG